MQKHFIYRLLVSAGVLLVVVGSVWRFMHWPGAILLLAIGGIVIVISFFFSTFIRKDEE